MMSEHFSNLTYDNAGQKMGDCDGPAFCVYSHKGYSRASMDVLLSRLRLCTRRRSDGLPLTAYIFLGVDSFDDRDVFVNCFDAGLAYDNDRCRWVLFYNVLRTVPPHEKWYTSAVCLEDTHDYRLVLDTSGEDGFAELAAYDLSLGGQKADSVRFYTKDTRRDGSNTVYYQNYAMDFPDYIKYTPDGRPSEDDWPQITLYNMDEGAYMKDLCICGCTLDGQPWTAEMTRNRSVWPDRTMTWIDAPIVQVACPARDMAWRIDFVLDRRAAETEGEEQG